MKTFRNAPGAEARRGRLLARPATPVAPGPTGYRPLELGEEQTALIFVPETYRPHSPAPLALMLHGAGGIAEHGMAQLGSQAEEMGIILAAPSSAGRTWDVIEGGYGRDVAFIDRALAAVFSEYAIDARRLAIGGFSDGASYALSLGLTNGDLFSHVIAFSPGFSAPASAHGEPDVYISHGTGDAVLPIDRCSRRIVPALRRAGYRVEYREFDGGHTVPPEAAQEAAHRLLA